MHDAILGVEASSRLYAVLGLFLVFPPGIPASKERSPSPAGAIAVLDVGPGSLRHAGSFQPFRVFSLFFCLPFGLFSFVFSSRKRARPFQLALFLVSPLGGSESVARSFRSVRSP